MLPFLSITILIENTQIYKHPWSCFVIFLVIYITEAKPDNIYHNHDFDDETLAVS